MQLIRVAGVATLCSNALASCIFVTYSESSNLLQLAVKIYRNGDQVGWVLLASVLTYAAGMLWNDLLDCERDRRLHPRRPLPSGRIALPAALVAGILLVLGALLAGLQLGFRGFCAIGIVLTLGFLYNAFAKHIPVLGSLVMGLTRAAHALFVLLMLGEEVFDRLVLGLSGHGLRDELAPGVWPLYPLLLMSWIMGTTWISELETRGGRRFELLLAGGLLALPLLAVPVQLFSAHWLITSLEEQALLKALIGVLWTLLLVGLVVWRILPSWLQAVQQLRRQAMGALTRRLLASLVLFDAALVATRQPVYAILVLLLAGIFALTLPLVRMD